MIVMGGAGNFATIKTLKSQTLHGSFAKRLAIRALMLAIFVSILPLMQIMRDVDSMNPFSLSFDGCDSGFGVLGSNSVLGRVLVLFTPLAFPHLRSGVCMENMGLTVNVAAELMSKNLLDYDSKALCVGQRSSEAVIALNELGLSDVYSIRKRKQLVYEFDFDDNLFDFVIMRDLNEVSVPALLVNEVERILKPGGVAAIVVGARGWSHDSLIRSATSVSSFLKSSTVAHVMSIGSFTVVAIKKQVKEFDGYRLPINCPSFKRNRQYMTNIEPLLEKKPEGGSNNIAYLPKFTNVTSNGNLVYIDMGVKEAANFNGTNWFLPSYPIESRAFSVYIVDHDALVLTSHVKSPGVTFIYHPALAERSRERMRNADEDEEPLFGEDGFDFFVWFKETVEFADFAVLKMNMGETEMNFLSKLFETGTICFVDELFLHCTESSCTDIFKRLRKVGVYVHQWWGN